MPSNPKRPIEAEDLYRFQLIRGAHLSPNGAHALYTLERVNPDTEKKHHNIWIVPTRDGEPKQFTFGDHQDRMPKWAPDGRTIAFLSNRANEEQFQIYLISFGGGEARRLTDLAGEFGSFAWSPDGRRVVCQFRQKDPAVRQRESDERKEKLGEVDRHITRVFYKHNDHGFLPQERWHLWVIDISSGTATQLTTGDTFDELTPSWSPDGQDILFTSNCTADPDLNPDAVDLYTISSTGGTPRRIPTPYGAKTLPAFSPDGRLIAYFGNEGGGDWWRNLGVWVVPADGSAAARDLTASYDIHAACHTANDTGNPTQMPPTWTPNGNRLFFQIDRHGCTEFTVAFVGRRTSGAPH